MSYQFRGIFVPELTKQTIDNYVRLGIPTGDFLEAVINNDLRRAFAFADEQNTHAMSAIVAYFYNECPAGCWGTPTSYDEWLSKKSEERATGNRR